MKKGDWGIALSVFLLFLTSLAPYFQQKNHAIRQAELWSDGQLVRTFDLSTQGAFTAQTKHVITWRPGAIRFTFSDCSDQDCVHAGWLDKAGATAICLPQRTVLRITKKRTHQKEGLDAVAH